MSTRIVTIVVVLASMATGCTQASSAERDVTTAPSPADAPDAPTEIVQFDDGLQHYVVTTTAGPLAGAVPPADGTDEAILGIPSGPLVVRSDAGYAKVTFDDDDLEAVVATADEQATIDEARRVGLLAFAVIDVGGAAGDRGARYLYVDGELRRSSEPAGADATGSGSGTGDRDDAVIAAEIRSLEGVVDSTVIAPGVISVASSQPLDDLSSLDGVVTAAPEVLFGVTGDPGETMQWALANTGDPSQAGGWPGTAGVDTGAPYAWDVASGAGITVAVIDSGVQLDHPDLATQIAANPGDACGDGVDGDGNGFVDDCRGWDFGDGDSDPSPSPSASNHAHGTHVAGIVAAARNGVGTVGIAPDARVLPIKVGRSDGAITMSSLIAAIHYAADRGADVINLSLSTSPGVSRGAVAQLESAVAYAGSQGVLVVAAAGNNGVDITVNSAWPASFSDLYPFVTTVGAHTNAGERASFSNYGSPVDVLAPGWWIYAPWPGGGHTFQSGTSMAAPAAAGAAAVVLSQRDRAPAEVRDLLSASGVASSSGPRLDLANAVGAIRDGAWSLTYRGADALRADEPGSFAVDVAGRLPGAMTMRVSVATLDQGQVAAVGGLVAVVSGPSGDSELVSDEAGAFGLLPAGGEELPAGVTFRFGGVALPAGQYAFVHEMLDGSGANLGGAQVVYLTVGADDTVVSTTTPAATSTTVPPVGGGANGPSVTPTSTTVAPDAGAGSSPGSSAGSSAPTIPGGTGGSSGQGDAGGSPSTTAAPPSQPPPGTVPSSTTPGGSSAATGTTTSTLPSDGAGPTTSAPGGAPTVPSTTAAAPPAGDSSPVVTTPVTTTPAPEGDRSGEWSLTGMQPRASHVAGGEQIVLTGVFPTWVPIYVWFGDIAVVRAEVWPDRLVVSSPPVGGPVVTDVIVRFRTSTSVELTLHDAFTFYTTPTGSDGSTGSTMPPATTAPGGAPGAGADGPGTTLPPIGAGTTTTSTTAAPSTTLPAPGPPTTVASTAPTIRTRGALTLRPVSPASSLASLSASGWPATGCAATCTGRSL